MNKNMTISIVIPVYGCEQCLNELVQRIYNTLNTSYKNWEVVLVDDGSIDSGWEEINRLSLYFPQIVGVELSKNFGQHSAITAGLSVSKGEWVIVMDCDLQDQPEEIINLLNKASEGFDAVLACRKKRKDPFLKRFFSKSFYRVFNKLSGQNYNPEIANFGCYNRKVIDAILSMGDYARAFPFFVRWVGFKYCSIEVSHGKRFIGKSSYTFGKSFRLALDSILSFSDKPLKVVVSIGLWISSISFLVSIVYFIGAINKLYKVEGWATIIISIWLLAGIIIFIIGIIGLYIARIFDQTKGRPVFIIRQIKRNSKEK